MTNHTKNLLNGLRDGLCVSFDGIGKDKLSAKYWPIGEIDGVYYRKDGHLQSRSSGESHFKIVIMGDKFQTLLCYPDGECYTLIDHYRKDGKPAKEITDCDVHELTDFAKYRGLMDDGIKVVVLREKKERNGLTYHSSEKTLPHSVGFGFDKSSSTITFPRTKRFRSFFETSAPISTIRLKKHGSLLIDMKGVAMDVDSVNIGDDLIRVKGFVRYANLEKGEEYTLEIC